MIVHGRKGNLGLIAVLLVFILVLVAAGFVFFLVKPVYDDVKVDLQEQFNPTADAMLDEYTADYPSYLDTAFMIVFAGFWIASLIVAWKGAEEPWLAVVLLIVIVAIAALGAYVSNTWIEFVSHPDRIATKADFPATDFLLSHLVEVILVVGFSSLCVYFYRNMTSVGGSY